jgi:hypothetical protein
VRTAALTFRLTASARVAVTLERRRCAGDRCRWRSTGERARTARAGLTTWRVGARLLGMPLRPGRWRVGVDAPAGGLRRVFRVTGR